jgi:uncharacterized protein YcbX
MPAITQLTLYPIKSCAGISLTEAVIVETGLSSHGIGDREWMVIDEVGNFLTQREHPRMALIYPQITTDYLEVRAENAPLLRVPLKSIENSRYAEVQIWEEFYRALEMGDEAAAWFSRFLGVASRLVRFDRSVQRLSSAKWTKGKITPNLFSDGFPLLLISEASLEDLNLKAKAQQGAHFPMNRFRPNIVINGVEAFEEDYAESLSVEGDGVVVELTPVKPCARCPIPSIDQATGEIGPSPLDVLVHYRANALLDGGITFGMNLIVSQGSGQSVRVGDMLDLALAFD